MKLKIYCCIFFSALFILSCSDDSTSPKTDLILEMINEVNSDSLKYNIEKLSGVKPVYIDGEEKLILSRHSYDAGNDVAADYIEKRLTQYGYSIINNRFNVNGRNVIAELKGKSNPADFLIICAHYDSMPLKGNAPGADDNASGVAAVMEAARLFKDKTPDYSVLFALWDEEEQGLIGSKHYAKQCSDENKNIIGVINLDMIAYDSDSDYEFSFVTLSENEIPQMVQDGLNIIQKYDLKLKHNFLYGRTYSDHASFWLYDYPAILIIEDYKDFNAYYHTGEDLETHINYPFLKKNTQLSIGMLTKMAFNINE